jgi:hypothetical protein
MPTANDFATRALQMLGVADAIDTISSEDADLALTVLNEWIDQLGTQRQAIYTVVRTTKTLANGTASYTIGTGGNIDIARPVWIQNVGLVLDTGASTLTEVPRRLFTDDEWASISQKSLGSGLISGVYYDYAWSSGLGTIYPWPVPNVGTTQLVLYVPTVLTEFANLSTSYTFPPGYERAIRTNLAMELTPYFPNRDRDNQLILQQALSSMLRIKRANVRLQNVPIDRALTRSGRGAVTESQFLGGTF